MRTSLQQTIGERRMRIAVGEKRTSDSLETSLRRASEAEHERVRDSPKNHIMDPDLHRDDGVALSSKSEIRLKPKDSGTQCIE